MNFIDVATIVVCILLTLVVGIWISKRDSKVLKSYFSDGNNIKWYFLGLSNDSSGQVSKESSNKNYLDEDIKEIILAKLNRLENETFFLDPKCNIHSLADVMQTNQKYLSQVINHEKNANFNNYINELRIDYLLNRLLEDKDYRNSKLTYIAATSGFNNLNTFYSAFKKRLGTLPSYFIEQLNEDEP